jgi:hypothetical protein
MPDNVTITNDGTNLLSEASVTTEATVARVTTKAGVTCEAIVSAKPTSKGRTEVRDKGYRVTVRHHGSVAKVTLGKWTRPKSAIEARSIHGEIQIGRKALETMTEHTVA